ncbi:MAG TPA: M56 family metallopeptidase [Thermoanaerobaculia bacterium]|nr:M56 family metallopeptidase [Thermoanaerobaculia bacterium]
MNPTWIDSALAAAAPAAAWMLTYLVHSTVLLGLASAAGWFLGDRRPALAEVIWKCALVGGLATATLQTGLGWTPLTGSWQLPAAGAAVVAEPSPARVGSGLSDAGVGSSPVAAPLPGGTAVSPTGSEPAAPRAAGEVRRVATGSRLSVTWPLLIVFAWLAVGLALAARLATDYLRLARSLRERWPVSDGAVAALFGRMLGKSGRRRPVALTGSERLPVPIAWGLAHPEVSLPARVLRDLSPYHQESILAHELAHVLRRDPAWLTGARLIEAVLFFQPLNRLARRRLQELAEYRCDDRAVELTGKPLELARCLTEVATWRLAGSAALPVPSMASGSSLGRRVRRLVDGDHDRRLPVWARPIAAAALLAVALAAPGVTGGRPAEAQQPEPAPIAAVAPAVASPAAEPVEPEPWVIVDGRSWEDLTPEERERVRHEVAEASRQAAAAGRQAGEHARRALEQARDQLRVQRDALRAVDSTSPLTGLEGLSGLIGGSVRLGLTAASAALAAVDVSAIEAEVARAMVEVEREMPRIEEQIAAAMAELEHHPRRHAEIAEAMAELEREMPRIEAEVAAAMREVERELAAEMPRIEAEIAAAMAEVERELARELPRIEAEIAAAMREVELELAAEMPRIEAEIAAALAEVERELAEIESEIEAQDLEDDVDGPE